MKNHITVLATLLVLIFSLNGIVLAAGPMAQPNLDLFPKVTDLGPLNFTGYVQSGYYHQFLDPDLLGTTDENGDKVVGSTFNLDRVWFKMSGEISPIWGNLSYAIVADLLSADSNVKQAWGAYSPGSWLQLKFGQQFVPFSRGFDYSPKTHPFLFYAGIENDNNPCFQQGLSISGIFFGGVLEYYAAVYNGSGRSIDNNDHKDVSGRIDLTPIPNLTFSGAWRNGVNEFGAFNQATGFADYKIWQLQMVYTYFHQTQNDVLTDTEVTSEGHIGYLLLSPIPGHEQFMLTGRGDTNKPNVDEDLMIVTWTAGVNYDFGYGFSAIANYVNTDERNSPEVKNDQVGLQFEFAF